MLAIAAFPQTAFAGTSNGKKDAAPGQVKKDGPADQNQADGNTAPSAGTPTAADNPEGYSNHDQTNGPGGQVCDGDPNNAPGAGGNYENTCPAGPSQNGAGDGQANGKPCAGCVGNADDKNPPGQATSGPTDHNNGYECDQKGRSANEGNNGVGYGNPAHTGCQGDTPPPPPCVPTAENHHCDTDCVPSAANNQCQPCPSGQNMGSNGCECPAGSTMGSNGKCETPCVPSTANNQCQPCPSGQNMGSNGCECPAGSTMGNSGTCETPCVPATGSVCGQETPSCVPSAANNRCGGGTQVLGETLGRPTEVLGVQLTAAPTPTLGAAPTALAFTGAHVLGLLRIGIVLALFGLALVLVTRRRRATVSAE